MRVHLIIKEVGTLDHGFSATQDFTLGLTGWLIFLLPRYGFHALQWLLYILTIIIMAGTTTT